MDKSTMRHIRNLISGDWLWWQSVCFSCSMFLPVLQTPFFRTLSWTVSFPHFTWATMGQSTLWPLWVVGSMCSGVFSPSWEPPSLDYCLQYHSNFLHYPGGFHLNGELNLQILLPNEAPISLSEFGQMSLKLKWVNEPNDSSGIDGYDFICRESMHCM